MGSSDSRTPDGIDMPALKDRRQATYVLLDPGPGTPWEDRGALGYPQAFFKTCFRSMRAPGSLLHLIRRLEYRTDARLFVIGCALFWFASCWVHAGTEYWRLSHSQLAQAPANVRHMEIDTAAYFKGWAAFSVLATVEFVLMVGLATRLYYPMVAAEEMRGRGSAELVYNVFAYCLGPSLLAPIPYVGPVVALLWIIGLVIYAGMNRLKVSFKGAAICTLIAAGACLATAAVTLYAGYRVWGWTMGDAVQVINPAIRSAF